MKKADASLQKRQVDETQALHISLRPDVLARLV
jgi:hypothetical protein